MVSMFRAFYLYQQILHSINACLSLVAARQGWLLFSRSFSVAQWGFEILCLVLCVLSGLWCHFKCKCFKYRD